MTTLEDKSIWDDGQVRCRIVASSCCHTLVLATVASLMSVMKCSG